MADSLVIAERIEVMGGPGGVPSAIPECAGATFRIGVAGLNGDPLALSDTFSLGAPQPATDIVESLLLDGERPFGRRASNRTITLPLVIRAPDMATLAGAREVLLAAIDQQTWTLTWTRDGGLPLVFDCFRAQPTVVQYGVFYGRFALSLVEIAFQALPYGRSDIQGMTQVQFSTPLPGNPSPPTPVILDNFSTVSGSQWSQSTQHVVGPNSAHFTPAAYPNLIPATYVKTFAAADITGRTALSVWFGAGWDTAHYQYWPRWSGKVQFAWTLTDSGGHTLKFSTTQKVAHSNQPGSPSWKRITAPIPQGSSTFLYNLVTGYTLTMTDWGGNSADPGPSLAWIHAYLDDVVANPPSLSAPVAVRGTVYTLLGTPGTARTPVSCQFQQPAAPPPVTTVLTGSGSWLPPVGVSTVKVEAIGGGGAGATETTTGIGGGGGGAEYAAEPSLALTSSAAVPYACGIGGIPATPGSATFTTAGNPTWTCPPGVTSVKAECWGGGGSGGVNSPSTSGGGGGGGEYAAEASVATTPGRTYNLTVGGPSGNSVFTGDAVTVTAHGGSSGNGGTSGLGGTGSTNTTHFAGGSGAGGAFGSGAGGGGGGAGGGSAGAGGNGGIPSGSTGGSGGTGTGGGGNGGAGGNSGTAGSNGSVPGGGGGGAGGSSSTAGTGAAGQVKLTWTSSPVNGGTTTFGTSVAAHGGTSAAQNSATGGAGGTGSTNTTHFAGGAGWTTTSLGGGGGSSGGSASAGNAATSQAGAAAVTGGGAGGSGSASAGAAPAAGAQPGGGGGGADSSGTIVTGGSGGPGQITLTYTPTLAPFKTLIVHRPGQDSPPSLTPFTAIANTSDPPDGREYTVPSLISGMNARFGGTYTVVVTNYTWDNPGASRTVTVTVHQYEYPGGPSYAFSVSRTFTPSADVTNGILVVGELTLPGKDIEPGNQAAYFTCGITDSDSADRFLDILFLDTTGQTCMINSPGTSYVNFFIDEPTTDRDLGRVLGSAFDRAQGVSVLDIATVSGGPISIDPGDNLFFCYCIEGAPALNVTYMNRWYLDRLS